MAVLGAVLNARFAALLPAALAAAGSDGERGLVRDAFRVALETGQTAGAAAVLAGGLVTAYLLHRARHR
ncbi:hypothetical protein AB0F68_05000 [Micromonospora sp. NPDC023966]|uniref:hypothetical protein n=1 Tax=Micromonospora sp. NPDC023966 TaxID=3154699 RepID=UPI0033FB80F3